MLTTFQQKLEQITNKLAIFMLGILLVTLIFGMMLFFICWAVYLTAQQFLDPVASALLVSLLLLTLLVLAVKSFQHYFQSKSAAGEGSISPPEGLSNPVNDVSCSVLAGLIYESQPRLRGDALELLLAVAQRSESKK